MSTFGSLSTFRVGYWQGIRGFLLSERRDVGRRLEVIDADLKRIGQVNVVYQTTTEEDGAIRATEKRVRMLVEENTSLERLMRAYIAQGGNPFDVSHFFYPGRAREVRQDTGGFTILAEVYPYGGVAAPENAEYNEPFDRTAYKGGWVPLHKYQANRTGDRVDRSAEAEPVTFQMIEARRWVGQEIAEKLHNLEAKIIKLCDLREQLEQEKDLLMASQGGTLACLPDDYHDPGGLYDAGLRTQCIVGRFDAIFFKTNEEGAVEDWKPVQGQLDPYHGIFWEDHPDEEDLSKMA